MHQKLWLKKNSNNELVLLFKFTTVEDATRERIDFYTDFIKTRNASMVKNQGKKSLAYPIKGFDIATVQIVYLENDTLIGQLNTEIQRDEFILRGLTTKLMIKVSHHLCLIEQSRIDKLKNCYILVW